MRFAIAIAVLALSGIALVLGIGQRTFLAPEPAVSYTLAESDSVNYAVIPAELLASVAGQVSVTVTGDEPFAATGSVRDIDAWVAIFDHAVIAGDAASKTLNTTTVDAVEAENPVADDPAAEDAEAATDAEAPETLPAKPVVIQGSDLWIEEAVVSDDSGASTQTARLTSFAVQSDRAVIVSTNDSDGLKGAVTLTWTQDQSTPWAGPLLVAGGVLALAGGVLYLLAVDHNHRGLGPRRGRKGPLQGIRGSMSRRRQARSVKRVAAPAVVLAGMLALSGCSASYWPDFSADKTEKVEVIAPSAEIAPVPITQTQISRILDDVILVADTADESLDSATLLTRFSGDALAQRTANYKIRATVPEYSLIPPHILDQELGYNLVQSTQGWPRTMFIALASSVDGSDEADGTDTTTGTEETSTPEASDGEAATTETPAPSSPSLGLILTQAGPHENYLVSRVISLRGGITMPEASPAEEGTALLASDLQTLVLAPGEVATAFSAVLQGGLEVPEAASFALMADDSLLSRSGLTWVQQSQERAAADGYSIQYSVGVQPGTEPITAFSVSDGGALVAVTVMEDRVSDTAGSTTRVRAEGAVTALSGLTGQQTRLVNTVAHQLLFYVPSKVSGGQIELLGATSEMVGASN